MANRDTALSREQHAFLQALMAKGAMPEKSAKKLYAEIASMDPAEANKTFSRFWNPIASALGYLDLDIRVIKYQEDGELYMGVVNKTGGEAAKLATRLTPEQIALFRVVLDEIMRDDRTVERGVDVITALNATQVAQTQVRRLSRMNRLFKNLAPRDSRPGEGGRNLGTPTRRALDPSQALTKPRAIRSTNFAGRDARRRGPVAGADAERGQDEQDGEGGDAETAVQRRLARADGRRGGLPQARRPGVPGAEGFSAGAGAGARESQVGEDALGGVRRVLVNDVLFHAPPLVGLSRKKPSEQI